MLGPRSSSRGLLLEREEQAAGTVDQEEGKNEYANVMTGDASSIAIESIFALDQLRHGNEERSVAVVREREMKVHTCHFLTISLLTGDNLS